MGFCACCSGTEACGWAALPKKIINRIKKIVNKIKKIVFLLQTGLDKLHVPYSYGWSIILLTLLVKTALFPITRKQVSSREELFMTGLLSTGLVPHMAF